MLSIFINLLLFVHVLVCLLIVGVVLMQRPKNEGLGTSLAADTTNTIFGPQASNALSTITRWLTGIFFVLTLILSSLYARQGREKTGVEQRLQESAQPIPTALPSIPTTTTPGAPTPEGTAPTLSPALSTPAPEAPKPAPAEPAKPAEPTPAPAPEAPKPVPAEPAKSAEQAKPAEPTPAPSEKPQ
jgi:preprotein translocase subunit SecG